MVSKVITGRCCLGIRFSTGTGDSVQGLGVVHVFFECSLASPTLEQILVGSYLKKATFYFTEWCISFRASMFTYIGMRFVYLPLQSDNNETILTILKLQILFCRFNDQEND